MYVPPPNLPGVFVFMQAGYCGVANVPQLHMGALVLRCGFRSHLLSKPQNTGFWRVFWVWFFFSAFMGCVMWMNIHALLPKIK